MSRSPSRGRPTRPTRHAASIAKCCLGELPAPEILAESVIWFAAGDQEVHLYAEPSGVAVNGQSTRHPCFRVADLSAVRGHLAGLGVETIDGVPEIPGRPRFFVRDPFGNALEFLELNSSR